MPYPLLSNPLLTTSFYNFHNFANEIKGTGSPLWEHPIWCTGLIWWSTLWLSHTRSHSSHLLACAFTASACGLCHTQQFKGVCCTSCLPLWEQSKAASFSCAVHLQNPLTSGSDPGHVFMIFTWFLMLLCSDRKRKLFHLGIRYQQLMYLYVHVYVCICRCVHICVCISVYM